MRLAHAYHQAAVSDEGAARPILAELLGDLGEDAFVKPPLYVDYGEHLSIGARTFINYNLTALDVAPIPIGEDCQLGPNVSLLTPTRPLEPPAAPRQARGSQVDHDRRQRRHRRRRRRDPRHPRERDRGRQPGPRPAGDLTMPVPTAPVATSQRRYDPGRRDRIIDACLDVISESGVAGTSHRKVAQAAAVPLGSMTYHFTGMNDLLHEAFSRFAIAASEQFEGRMAAAHDADAAKQAVADAITNVVFSSQRDLVLTHELYTLAARNADYRDITNAWMARSRRILEQYFDPTTARILDALVEGLSIHRALDNAPQDQSVVGRSGRTDHRRISGPALSTPRRQKASNPFATHQQGQSGIADVSRMGPTNLGS